VRRRFLAGLLLAAWLSAGGPAWAGLQPGSYEMTTTVTMPGMPEPQSVTMQGHRSNGHLDVTFAAAGMDGSIVMQVETGPQGAQHVTTTIKAVRRGDCS
jgi:trimethylamine:corrinoid methyltransferase-like protein